MTTNRTVRRVIAATLAIVITATACGGGSADEPQADETEAPTTSIEDAGAAREVQSVAPVAIDPAELDPEAIVAATVLIVSGGDLEAAISAGIVTEAEAEAALRALEADGVAELLD